MTSKFLFLTLLSICSIDVYAESAVSGVWQGQIEYLTSSDTSANEVVPFAFKLVPTGGFVGTTPANGCTFVGLYGNGYGGKGQYNVGFSLKNCKNNLFNGRYSGSIQFKNEFQDGRFTASGMRTIQEKNQTRFLNLNLSANFFKQ